MVTRQKESAALFPIGEKTTPNLQIVEEAPAEPNVNRVDDHKERVRLAAPFGVFSSELLKLHQFSRLTDIPTRVFEKNGTPGQGRETLNVLFMAEITQTSGNMIAAETEVVYLDDGIQRLSNIRFFLPDGSEQDVPLVHPYDPSKPSPTETERAISAMEAVLDAARSPILNPDLAQHFPAPNNHHIEVID